MNDQPEIFAAVVAALQEAHRMANWPRSAGEPKWKPEAAATALLRDLARLQRPVWTYKNQPNNVDCWGIGEACRKAADDPKCGDYIDRGLILLKELQAKGYGLVGLPGADAP